MLFKRISRTSPETAFIVVKNVSGSTMTAGYTAMFDNTTTADGVGVTMCTSGSLQAFAGIVDADIANGAYGLAQVYGYRSAGYVIASGAVTSGENLIPEDGKWSLTCTANAATSGFKAFAYICQSIASATQSTAANKRIFIRAL